jgi:hypothetical protein
MFATVRAMLSSYNDDLALRQLEAETPATPLVQIAAIAAKPTLQGTAVTEGPQLAEGVEKAFDYRGDVTIKLKTGGELDGYLFDRDKSGDLATSKIRIMLKSDRRKVTVTYSDIEHLSFSGRDMADGRSWEAWVKKYFEKKAAGETNIELIPEAIE